MTRPPACASPCHARGARKNGLFAAHGKQVPSGLFGTGCERQWACLGRAANASKGLFGANGLTKRAYSATIRPLRKNGRKNRIRCIRKVGGAVDRGGLEMRLKSSGLNALLVSTTETELRQICHASD